MPILVGDLGNISSKISVGRDANISKNYAPSH